jgi:hypothetical protein
MFDLGQQTHNAETRQSKHDVATESRDVVGLVTFSLRNVSSRLRQLLGQRVWMRVSLVGWLIQATSGSAGGDGRRCRKRAGLTW